MVLIRLKLFPLVALALLGACGGTPTDGGNGNGNGNGDTRTIKDNPSFAVDIQEIFVRNGCTTGQCHGFNSAEGGLSLASASASFSDLVNVSSVGNPNVVRVVPNDPVNSYLVQKLEGTAGTRMPQGLGALDNIDMTNIKNWINKDALNN
jgi:hypothetical protein